MNEGTGQRAVKEMIWLLLFPQYFHFSNIRATEPAFAYTVTKKRALKARAFATAYV